MADNLAIKIHIPRWRVVIAKYTIWLGAATIGPERTLYLATRWLMPFVERGLRVE